MGTNAQVVSFLCRPHFYFEIADIISKLYYHAIHTLICVQFTFSQQFYFLLYTRHGVRKDCKFQG